SGLTQEFANIPANHRVTIVEGKAGVTAVPFSHAGLRRSAQTSTLPVREAEDTNVSTWLLDPLPAPDFSLPYLTGKAVMLSAFGGKPLLLYFWAEAGERSVAQLRELQRNRSSFAAKNLQLLAVHADKNVEPSRIRSLAAREKLTMPMLLATADTAGAYNILYRFL